MGPNSDKVKDFYQISNVQSTLLSFAVFIAFAVFSVPGGLLSARIGRKKLLLLGLGINAASLVIPSVMVPNFWVLLGCIFLLGVGTTCLQVSGNPIMRNVSAEGKYSRNLAFAQGIKGIGSTASTYLLSAIAAIAIFEGMDWRAGFPLFCALMALAFVSVLPLKVEESTVEAPPSIGSSLGLLIEPIFFLAVLGIFLYVGAEASMGRFLAPVLQDFGLDKKESIKYGPAAFFLLLTIGRLLGSAILDDHEPAHLLSPFGTAGNAGRRRLDDRLEVPGVRGHRCRRTRFRQHLANALLDHRRRTARTCQRTFRPDVYGHLRRRHRAAVDGMADR